MRAFFILWLLLAGCGGFEESEKEKWMRSYRKHTPLERGALEEHLSEKNSHISEHKPIYFWREHSSSVSITQDHFRCMGSVINPPRVVRNRQGQLMTLLDCGGAKEHSLPLKDQQEYINPMILELCVDLCEKTDSQIDILAGHLCQAHARYLDYFESDKAWKHAMGEAVQFCVRGFELRGRELIDLLAKLHQAQLQACHAAKKQIHVTEEGFYSAYLKVTFCPKPWWEKPRDFDKEWVGIEVKADLDTGKLCAYDSKRIRDLHRY